MGGGEVTLFTVPAIRAAHAALGGHWFDAESVKFHGARVESGVTVIGDHSLFVESSTLSGSRRYGVVVACPDGRLRYTGSSGDYASLGEAKTEIINLVWRCGYCTATDDHSGLDA